MTKNYFNINSNYTTSSNKDIKDISTSGNYNSLSKNEEKKDKEKENKTNGKNFKNNLISEKSENENENDNENEYEIEDLEKTTKIKYKNIQKIFNVGAEIKKQKENYGKKNKFYWFAAYDKLIRTKNIKKIFSFYEREREKEKEENSLININNTFISNSKNSKNNNNNWNKKIVILLIFNILNHILYFIHFNYLNYFLRKNYLLF
jgi:hypothetical protein